MRIAGVALVALLVAVLLCLAVAAARAWPSRGSGRRSLRRVAPVVLLLAVLVPVVFAARWMLWPYDTGVKCPLEKRIEDLQHPTVVVDRRGAFAGMVDPLRGRYVRLSDLPPGVVEVFVGREDKRFWAWYNRGVDPVGVMTAAFWSLAGRRRGASTIAMQTARILCGPEMPPDGTWRGKLAEAAVGLDLIDRLGKESTLELYISGVYIGHGRRGLDAAADEYFDKRAEELTVPEAAQVAALVRAPGRLDPTELSDVRRTAVRTEALESARPLLAAAGVGDSVLQQSVRIAPRHARARSVRDFISVAAEQARPVRDTLHTSLDLVLQNAAERELFHLLRAVGEQGRASRKRDSDRLLGLYVAVDAETGEVLAYVSRRWDDPSGPDWVQTARILPSSTLKALLFAAAYDHAGVRLEQPLWEVERDRCPGIWMLPWARGMRGRGNPGWTVQRAFQPSANDLGPCLLDAIPPEELHRLASRGIVTANATEPVEGLGISPMRPLDLLMGFAAIAAGGEWREASFTHGAAQRRGERVFSVNASSATLTALEGVVEAGTARGMRRYLEESIPAAGKTGTSSRNKELLFVGISGRVVSLVWLGYPHPRPVVRHGAAGSVVAPAWARIMSRYYAQGGLAAFGVGSSVW